jgi:thiol-disulfide isomerase/thioredoxin
LHLLLWAALVPGIGDPAPRLDLVTAAGPRLESVPADTVTVVEFFATWCIPCRENLEDLQATRSTLGDHFRVVVVAVEGDRPRVRAFFAERPALADVVVAFDPGAQAARRWGEERLPTTFFVDRGAVVRHINRGHGAGFRARATRWLQGLIQAGSAAPADQPKHQ